jgi:hypothetical protein
MSARSKKAAPAEPPAAVALVRRHLVVGWWALLVFLTLGVVLEALHGFKVGWYLDLANETRRLMFRLGHAHGALLGLVNVAFALTLRALGEDAEREARVPSLCLLAATVLLPGGFLLGGLVVYGGDPGRGVLLVPVGAALFFVAVAVTALRVTRAR